MKADNFTLAHDLVAVFPGLRDMKECPDCQDKRQIFSLIQHLNDRHTWTREAIADWLEALDSDLTLVTGQAYDNARARIEETRSEVPERLTPQQSAESAVEQMLKTNWYHLGWIDEVQKFYSWDAAKTEEELLKERLNISLQEGMLKVSESLSQFGTACSDALEAIQKFTINYEEIVKKEQVA